MFIEKEDLWMHRQWERQQLIDKIKNKVIEQYEFYDELYAVLCKRCLDYLFLKMVEKNDFKIMVLTPIQNFSRMHSETRSLVCDMAVWLLATSTNRTRGDMLRDEIMHPNKMFEIGGIESDNRSGNTKEKDHE